MFRSGPHKCIRPWSGKIIIKKVAILSVIYYTKQRLLHDQDILDHVQQDMPCGRAKEYTHTNCVTILAYEYMTSTVARRGGAQGDSGIAGYLQSMTVSVCFVW
jgi:hypothetical protein